MDAHEGGVEPRKPGRSDFVSTPTSLGVRMNEGSYPASLTEWSGYYFYNSQASLAAYENV